MIDKSLSAHIEFIVFICEHVIFDMKEPCPTGADKVLSVTVFYMLILFLLVFALLIF